MVWPTGQRRQGGAAGLQLGVVEECLPRGETDQGQRGRVGERDARRSRRQALGRGDDVLRRGAVDDEREEADHPVGAVGEGAALLATDTPTSATDRVRG
jgi:hypothetical protein